MKGLLLLTPPGRLPPAPCVPLGLAHAPQPQRAASHGGSRPLQEGVPVHADGRASKGSSAHARKHLEADTVRVWAGSLEAALLPGSLNTVATQTGLLSAWGHCISHCGRRHWRFFSPGCGGQGQLSAVVLGLVLGQVCLVTNMTLAESLVSQDIVPPRRQRGAGFVLLSSVSCF